MAEKHETGKKGEKLSRAYLEENGYTIMATNWQYGHKELDIIAKHDGRLVVVEVKSTIADRYSNPSELLSVRKMRHIVDATEAYIFSHNIKLEVRFDLMIVIFSGGGHRIEHIESAFIPGVNW